MDTSLQIPENPSPPMADSYAPHFINFQFSIFNYHPFKASLIVLAISFLAAGCSSTKPPPPQPRSVAAAERSASQALRQSQAQNWVAAAREWKISVDNYALLNDQARQAIALHNLGQAESQTGELDQAHGDFEAAARLNEKLGRKEEWWRNQVALLELESQRNNPGALEERFKRLLPAFGEVKNPAVRGLFLNELGLFQAAHNEANKAGQTFQQARQEFQTAKDDFGLATVMANEALLAEAEKQYPVALQRWQAALGKFESVADPKGIAAALAGLGRSTLAIGQDLPKAEDYLRRAAHNFHTLKSSKKEAETLEMLAKALEQQGKKAEAESIRAEAKAPSGDK